MSPPDQSPQAHCRSDFGRGSNMAALLRNDCGGDVVGWQQQGGRRWS